MPKLPGQSKCPKCERWAYMAGGKCEFCRFEHTVSGRIVDQEIVRETAPAESGEGFRTLRYEEPAGYRDFLAARIEGETGPLYGEGKGLFSLDTPSLEKLYRNLKGSNPKEDYLRRH